MVSRKRMLQNLAKARASRGRNKRIVLPQRRVPRKRIVRQSPMTYGEAVGVRDTSIAVNNVLVDAVQLNRDRNSTDAIGFEMERDIDNEIRLAGF